MFVKKRGYYYSFLYWVLLLRFLHNLYIWTDNNLPLGLAIGTLCTAVCCAPILIICLCACICSLIYKSLGKKSAPTNTFIINQAPPTFQALQPSQAPLSFQAPQQIQAPTTFQAQLYQTQHLLHNQLLPSNVSNHTNNRVLMQEHPPSYTPNAIHQLQAPVASNQSWNSHNRSPANRPLP